MLWHTRLCTFANLVYFTFWIFPSCTNSPQAGISIGWDHNKAVRVIIPELLFKDLSRDSLPAYLKVCLLNDPQATAILGDVQLVNEITFEPLIPFSRGSVYEVYYRNKRIGRFQIPDAVDLEAPVLLTCYPQQDTLPENLLKFYLAFSHPMREGQSDQYITCINSNKDTLEGVFLNLQPELWNEDRTVITVWLDPGRIKRNLQPNIRYGNPLKAHENYRLLVSSLWKDAQGVSLKEGYSKSFVVTQRDGISPDPDGWKLKLPAVHSNDALIIISDEPLDHFLFNETLTIKDQQGSLINGKVETYQNDRYCRFIPSVSWKPGSYDLHIESRLEDLAGNNLNRPFDRDITQTTTPSSANYHIIKFNLAPIPNR